MKLTYCNLDNVYLNKRGNFRDRRYGDLYLFKEFCSVCNEPYLTSKKRPSIFCSKSCAASSRTGEKATHWCGGKARGRHWGTIEYRNWHFSILKRDEYTCQRCGMVGVKFNAHHIYSWLLFPSLRYETWNGLSLCKECHLWVHSDQNTNKEFMGIG